MTEGWIWSTGRRTTDR